MSRNYLTSLIGMALDQIKQIEDQKIIKEPSLMCRTY
jgi:hypothetical protein